MSVRGLHGQESCRPSRGSPSAKMQSLGLLPAPHPPHRHQGRAAPTQLLCRNPAAPAHLICVVLLTAVQVQGSDVVLHITVEHSFPELDVGPHHVLLHTAVGKLRDAWAQFLRKQKRDRRVLSECSPCASLSSADHSCSLLLLGRAARPWTRRRDTSTTVPPRSPCKHFSGLLSTYTEGPGEPHATDAF